MADDTAGGSTAALDASRAETRAAFANRALMYAAIFGELEEELGTERAAEIMKRAIYKRGIEIGQRIVRPPPQATWRRLAASSWSGRRRMARCSFLRSKSPPPPAVSYCG